ncbi:MAG: alpha/beta hydrolase [Chitinophagaceae bacterium]
MQRKWRVMLATVFALAALYFLGPSAEPLKYQLPQLQLASEPKALAALVAQQEAALPLKPDNQAEIVWANDTMPAKTKYAIVYLPGFSATKNEADPVHKHVAKALGANMYLARLYDHGLNTEEPFLNFNAEQYWQSAVQALAIGEQIGDSVILMSTSTGGTLALMLCADDRINKKIAGNIMLSPNIAINDGAAFLLNNHWGLQIARMVLGDKYIYSSDQREDFKKYWYSKYRIEGAVGLQELIESSMNVNTFKKVKQPMFMLYYYKNDAAQDKVVKVSAMLDMFDRVASEVKVKQALPNAGDHVLANPIKSKDIEGVQAAILKFCKRYQ